MRFVVVVVPWSIPVGFVSAVRGSPLVTLDAAARNPILAQDDTHTYMRIEKLTLLHGVDGVDGVEGLLSTLSCHSGFVSILQQAADASLTPVSAGNTIVLTDASAGALELADSCHVQSSESYDALFPSESEAFVLDSTEPSGDELCFLVHFHIQPSCVEAFKALLLDECISVLINEPGMLRYDLYHNSIECKFVILEVLADATAVSVHEARRADGTMRAALATMEAAPHKLLAATGTYTVHTPAVSRLRWPPAWREAATLRSLCSAEFVQPPPSFIESRMLTKVAHAAQYSTLRRRQREWLSRHIGREVASVRCADHKKLGGLSGSFTFLHVHFGDQSYGDQSNDRALSDDAPSLDVALKTIPEVSLPRSVMLGNAREGLFYKHLAPLLASAGVPATYAAMGDMQTGESLVLMECLRGALPAGVFFGPGNPNNWGVTLPDADGPRTKPVRLSAEAFKLYARLHASYWGATPTLTRMPWLRGAEWAGGGGESTWQSAMTTAADAWAALSAARRDGTSKIVWDAHLVACLDVSFARAEWSAFLGEQATRPLTLVHGDCHPHNVLLAPLSEADGRSGEGDGELGGPGGYRLRLVDFEMVGLGSGAQELGQFLISHMDPSLRRTSERELVSTYHTELLANLRARGLESQAKAYTLDACWAEYIAGGAGRWAWFVAYLAHAMPSLGQFFHDQLAAFLHDHVRDPALAPMPRV